MHILIITHVDFYSIYGAATSLRHHIEVIRQRTGYKVKITVVNRVPFKTSLKYALKGSRIGGDKNFTLIDVWSLPFENNYDGHGEDAENGGVAKSLKRSVRNALYKLTLQKIRNIILKKEVSVLHLNASVLTPVLRDLNGMLGDRCPLVVMHIRDFIKKSITTDQRRDLALVDKFICIDKGSSDRLREVVGKEIENRSIILQNLFVRTDPQELRPVKELETLAGVKKYVIVGRISELKGVRFVLDAFLEAELDKAVLIIVGNGDGDYYDQVLEKCNLYPGRLLYIPEFSDLAGSDLYYKADFLVRGDESFRTGRTVYEALAYDTAVILAGEQMELEADPDLLHFKDRVFLYQPINSQSLTSLFIKTNSQTYCKRLEPDSVFETKMNLYFEKVSAVYKSVKEPNLPKQ